MVLQIIILAGGRGGNLYPLTTHIPKMLLPICNKAMIIYSLEMLSRSGCKFHLPILILTQKEYQKKLEKYLETRFRVINECSYEVVGVPEDYPGTSGSLRYLYTSHHITRQNNDLLIISADLLLDFSVLPSFIDCFRLNGSGCSVLAHTGKAAYEEMQVFGLNNSQIVQIFEWVDNEDGFSLPIRVLQRFPRMRLRNDLIQNYCYLFKSSVLKTLLDDERTERMFKLKEDLIPFLIKRQSNLNTTVELFIVPLECFSKRVYDIRGYLEANMLCCSPLTGKEKNGQPTKPLPLVLLSTENSARNVLVSCYRAGAGQIPDDLKGVSSDCVIQEEFKIGAKCSITKSLIGKNVRIGNKVKIVGSVIMDNVTIDDDVNVNNSIIGPYANIGAKCKVLNSQMASSSTVLPGITLKDDIRLSIN